jgi:hypothetical protein
MKRTAPKRRASGRSVKANLSSGLKRKKAKTNRISGKEREKRIARGKGILKKLFALGEEMSRGLDTETIVRIAEDKDLEYM